MFEPIIKFILDWFPLPFFIFALLTGFLYLVSRDLTVSSILAILIVLITMLIKASYEIVALLLVELRQNANNDLINLIRERKYRRSYLQHIIFSHRTFDVKGLTTQGIYSLELEKVFVDLRINPESNTSEQLVPTQVPHGGRQIWEFLLWKPTQHLVILGAPGSGKTTLLKFIALTLSNHKRKLPRQIRRKIPIILFIRDHAKAIDNEVAPTLIECILTNLRYKDESDKPSAAWFERLLTNGKCIVMLDGLDEVADIKVRAKVVAWVEAQMVAYGKNRFVISSRPRGYRTNPISGVTQLDVLPFSDTQVDSFVHNWYLATEIMGQRKYDEGVELDAQRGEQDLLRRIRSSEDIAKLSVNPLLLTMISNVHRWRSSLPGRRVELYAEMCDVFLGKRDEAIGVHNDLTPAQKQSVLQPLAYRMLVRKTREVTLTELKTIITPSLQTIPNAPEVETFIQQICERSGIMIEREKNIFAFSHKTFQEYLAAVRVGKEKRLLHDLIEHIKDEDDWWHEAIRLYCAIDNASLVIEACLEEEHLSIQMLRLALECADEALSVDPLVQTKLRWIIDESLDTNNVERRKIAAEALLALRLRRMIMLDKNVFVDASPITNAEYQLFLDDFPQYAPPHWDSNIFPLGSGRLPVLGITSLSAKTFCTWLTERNAEKSWVYRLPHLGEISDADHWVYNDSSIVLAEYTNNKISFEISELLEDNPDIDEIGIIYDRAVFKNNLEIPLRCLNRMLCVLIIKTIESGSLLGSVKNRGMLTQIQSSVLTLDTALAYGRASHLNFAQSIVELARLIPFLKNLIQFNIDSALNRINEVIKRITSRNEKYSLDYSRSRLRFNTPNYKEPQSTTILQNGLFGLRGNNYVSYRLDLLISHTRFLMENLRIGTLVEPSMVMDYLKRIKDTNDHDYTTYWACYLLTILAHHFFSPEQSAHTLLKIPQNMKEDFQDLLLNAIVSHLKSQPEKQATGNNEAYTQWEQILDTFLALRAAYVTVEKRRKTESGWEPYEVFAIAKENLKSIGT